MLLSSSISLVVHGQKSEALLKQFERLSGSSPQKAMQMVDSLAAIEGIHDLPGEWLELMRAEALFAMNEYPRAKLNFLTAGELAKQNNNLKVLARSQVGMAQCSYRLSDVKNAIIEAEQGLRYAKEAEDISSEAKALTLTGNVLMNQKDFAGALSYFNKALEIHAARGDSSQMAANLNNIGNVHLESKEYKEAEAYFNKTLAIDSALGGRSYVAGDYNNLGLVMKNRGDLETALKYQMASLEINRELHLPFGVAGNFNNLGNIYQGLGKPDEALRMFNDCLELADSLGYQSIKNDAMSNMADVYMEMGEYERANQYLKDLVSSISQIYSDDVAKKLTSFNDLYDLMQKENEIRDLQQREALNQVRVERERLWYLAILLMVIMMGLVVVWWMRTRSLKEGHRLQLDLQHYQLKAIQLQMNPHFLFNTLGAIGNYIEEHNAGEASRYLSKFSKLMRNFLEAAEHSVTTIEREMTLLTRYLELEQLRSDHSFEFEVTADESLYGTALPSMVLQPIVENSVLHGVRKLTDEKGVIRVHFFKEDEETVCEVSDNGPGFAPKQESKGKHSSIGMQLIQKRLQLLSKESGQSLQLKVKDRKEGVRGASILIYLGSGEFKSR
ncbi:MAG: tetratricopeptide repeat protein [Flavobacteriales bacterium]|nr:tetratricopeptide repeat protein [Flavobacteriales bacterium]